MRQALHTGRLEKTELCRLILDPHESLRFGRTSNPEPGFSVYFPGEFATVAATGDSPAIASFHSNWC